MFVVAHDDGMITQVKYFCKETDSIRLKPLRFCVSRREPDHASIYINDLNFGTYGYDVAKRIVDDFMTAIKSGAERFDLPNNYSE
jgi:hypothetical protein